MSSNSTREDQQTVEANSPRLAHSWLGSGGDLGRGTRFSRFSTNFKLQERLDMQIALDLEELKEIGVRSNAKLKFFFRNLLFSLNRSLLKFTTITNWAILEYEFWLARLQTYNMAGHIRIFHSRTSLWDLQREFHQREEEAKDEAQRRGSS